MNGRTSSQQKQPRVCEKNRQRQQQKTKVIYMLYYYIENKYVCVCLRKDRHDMNDKQITKNECQRQPHKVWFL